MGKPTLLIVDDEAEMRLLLSSIFFDPDYEISEATNGRDALLHVELNPRVKVVVLDLMMPIVDGMQFLREVPRPVSTLVLTAKVDASTERKCLELGARAFRTKPYNTTEVRELVLGWLAEP